MSSNFYDTTSAPAGYSCGKCGAVGVKLWRDYQTFLNHQTLRCVDCSCDEQKKPRLDIFEKRNGMTFHIPHDKYQDTDQIGWRVPAVPTEEGDTYWGYSSVPLRGVQWWWKLPLRIEQPLPLVPPQE